MNTRERIGQKKIEESATFWNYLVDQYRDGNVTVMPLRSPDMLLAWRGKNQDFDEYVDAVSRRNWRCLNRHEARIFLIQTPCHASIVWMSWLGYRGCRWHVVMHFAMNRDEPTAAAKRAALNLTEKYQKVWSALNMDDTYIQSTENSSEYPRIQQKTIGSLG